MTARLGPVAPLRDVIGEFDGVATRVNVSGDDYRVQTRFARLDCGHAVELRGSQRPKRHRCPACPGHVDPDAARAESKARKDARRRREAARRERLRRALNALAEQRRCA